MAQVFPPWETPALPPAVRKPLVPTCYRIQIGRFSRILLLTQQEVAEATASLSLLPDGLWRMEPCRRKRHALTGLADLLTVTNEVNNAVRFLNRIYMRKP